MKKEIKVLILSNPEGIAGSSGRHIRIGDTRSANAEEIIPLNEFNGVKMPGFLVKWKKSGIDPIFVPASNIKAIVIYSEEEAKKLGIVSNEQKTKRAK